MGRRIPAPWRSAPHEESASAIAPPSACTAAQICLCPAASMDSAVSRTPLSGSIRPHGMRRKPPGEDQAGLALRPRAVERRQPLNGPVQGFDPGVHRTHDDAVAQGERAELRVARAGGRSSSACSSGWIRLQAFWRRRAGALLPATRIQHEPEACGSSRARGASQAAAHARSCCRRKAAMRARVRSNAARAAGPALSALKRPAVPCPARRASSRLGGGTAPRLQNATATSDVTTGLAVEHLAPAFI